MELASPPVINTERWLGYGWMSDSGFESCTLKPPIPWSLTAEESMEKNINFCPISNFLTTGRHVRAST